MNNLEKQLNNEILHEKDSKSALSVIKVQFDKFIHSELLEPSNYNSYDLETRQDFKDYTNMKAQTFKETIIQNMDSIEQCIVERAHHEQEIQNRLKRLNERKLQILECKVQKVKALNASSRDTDSSGIVSDKRNNQTCDDERVALANLIANLKLEIDENKKIQNQLKKANTSLTQELKECKYTLEETNRTLWESNSTRDSCLIAIQNKQTELEMYKTFNDCTIDYDKLERKLNETLGLLAQKEIDIEEGLKLKAYEISIVKEKHDELVKQSLLTKLSYEGLVKEKTKIITDLKLKEETNLDKLIAMEKKLKFFNELIPYDTSDLANRFTPDREETLTLEQEKKLSKQTETVSKEVYNKLLRSFCKLENHSISLELVLQQCQEQMKNDTVCKQNGSTIFLKEREQYFEIQDLKAQLQDKNIAINAHTELQCLYQHKINECECLAEKLSKQTETVSKEVYNELLRSFAKLENHSVTDIHKRTKTKPKRTKPSTELKEREKTRPRTYSFLIGQPVPVL
ncbi:hypothetical protein Tco_0710858 [Tanacetum coccineum]